MIAHVIFIINFACIIIITIIIIIKFLTVVYIQD